MMNIQSAVRQMRVARRLGKLSLDQQNRLMRRLAPRACVLRWERMMALRASIERDIQPALMEKRKAEAEAFQVRFLVERANRPAVPTVTVKVTRPALVGYEYTPEWWKEAELRERNARKAGLLAD